MIVEYADWNSGGGLSFEIYNPTCDTIDLTDYKVTLYENGSTSPFGGTSYSLAGKLAPGATLVIRNRTTTPASFISCYRDTTIQALGLTGNAALVLSKGSSLTNFVDMIGAYGFNLCSAVAGSCSSYPEPTAKVGGVTQALYLNRIVRDSGNCIRYTSVDGVSPNSWPHDTGTNVPGWKVAGPGTCVVKGFNLSSLSAASPMIQGASPRQVCLSSKDTLSVIPANMSDKLKWRFLNATGSVINGSDSSAKVVITSGNTAGYDTLIITEYASCGCVNSTMTDTLVIQVLTFSVGILPGTPDTVCTGQQGVVIKAFHSGPGSVSWKLLNGSATDSTVFTGFPGGDSILVNFAGIAGADTFIVSKQNASCGLLTDTLFITRKSCSCTNIIISPGDTSLCAGQQLQLMSNSASDWYLLDSGDSTLLGSDTNAITYAAGAGKDTLIAINGGCTDTVIITFHALPVINNLNDTSACPGDSVTISFQAMNFTHFTWSPVNGLSNPFLLHPEAAASSPVTYHLLLADSVTGCSSRDSFTFGIYPLPVISGIRDTSICQNDSVQLNPSLLHTLSVQWSAGLGCQTCFNPYAKPGTHILAAYSPKGCITKDTIIITGLNPPAIEVSADDTICMGDSIMLSVSGGNTCSWSTGDTLRQIWVNPLSSSYYWARTFNGACASAADSVFIYVAPKPKAAFSPDPANGEAPLTVKLKNTSQGAVDYKWYLPGQQFSNEFSPEREFKDTGLFEIRLLVYNNYGCADSISSYIKINTRYHLTIPNAFTPNNDGINDHFSGEFTGIISLEGRIFNRWGELVREFGLLSDPWWDGTTAGSKCPDGVYFFIITCRDNSSKEHNLSGTITLLR